MSSDRRRLSDPTELRALSHPTRLALLDVLNQEGPLTATGAGELIGESPASCSFHLRTLARYGFVEEAPGGRGRQRPWRLVRQVQEIPGDDLPPDARIAADAFVALLRDRDAEQLRRWDATRHHYPAPWRDAATELRAVLWLTPEELAGVAAAVEAALAPYASREPADPGTPGALPVSVGVHAVPTRLPTPTDLPAESGDPARPDDPTGGDPAPAGRTVGVDEDGPA